MISIQLPVVLFQLALIAVRANESIATPSSCQIGTSQDGCRYVLSFHPSESHCHSVTDLSAESSRHPPSSQAAPSGDEPSTVKKLDHLELKLTRMMEELSVRSLRHIRQIKLDLRQLMTSVRDIKVKQTRPPTTGSGNVIAGAGRAGVPCLPEFVRVGPWPSCYRFSLFNATWHEAREYCSAFGANLLALDSLKEAHIIDYLIKSNPEYQESDSWWTSGNYMGRNQRWMWTSKHHLKPISYSRWAPGESEAKANMHCMLLYKPMKYYWREAVCSDKHTFICEMEL